MTGLTDTALLDSSLPDKPSELLRVALTDLQKGEEDPDFEVHMGVWLVQIRQLFPSRCRGCMAGAVMRYSLGIMPEASYESTPLTVDRVTARGFSAKLLAINSFRIGRIHEALDNLGLEYECELRGLPSFVTVTDYKHSHEQFKKEMRGIIAMLESHNL